MKTEVFVQALNDVEDKYIEEAANYRRSSGHMKIWRGIAVAACACLAASIGFSLIGINMMRNEERAAKSVSNDMYFEEAAYDEAEYFAAYAPAAYEEAYEYEAAYEDDVMFDADGGMPLGVMNTFSDTATISEKANMAAANTIDAENAAMAPDTAEAEVADMAAEAEVADMAAEAEAADMAAEAEVADMAVAAGALEEAEEAAEVMEAEEETPTTFGEKVSNAFSQGVKGFTTFIKNAAIWLSGAWIWILVAAAVAAAAFLITRAVIKRK